MRQEILEGLVKGHLGFSAFIRLVFARVLRVVAVCLTLTLIVWLVWLGKFTFGAFLAGAAVGFSVFLMVRCLRHYLINGEAKESPDVPRQLGDIADPEKVQPRTEV
ncbi:MAG: hypothetical protein GTO24_06820 [candidate division Zixibacteria bacterium]|nr:hypothetical protein [candidate division Zixibacteria bacterium]